MLRHFVCGFFLGIANIIPGVSGGTMALVLGIYERLISAISSINASAILTLLILLSTNSEKRLSARNDFQRLDILFMLSLGLGALAAIVLLSRLIIFLLTSYHEPSYAFFFGLIFVSIIVPLRLINAFKPRLILPLVAGCMIVVGAASFQSPEEKIANAEKKVELKSSQMNASSSQTSHSKSLGYFFVVGAIAISAMILPGISGSFIMILFGAYFDILQAISQRDLPVVVSMAAGCLLGLAIFTRLLNWLLSRYHDETMSLLSGLMLGSLYGLWPFQNFEMIGGRRVNLGPTFPVVDLSLVYTTLFFFLGAVIVAGFLKIEKGVEK